MIEEEFRTGKFRASTDIMDFSQGTVEYVPHQAGVLFKCGFCNDLSPHVHRFPVPVEQLESYAQHPKTIGDIKSDKTGDAKDWGVRDALIRTLREIDNGEIDPKKIVMVMALKRSPEDMAKLPSGACTWATMTRQAGVETIYETYGLLAWGQHVIARED